MIWSDAEHKLQVGAFLSVTAGVLVLFVGKSLNEHVAALRTYNIPEPVAAASPARLWACRACAQKRAQIPNRGHRLLSAHAKYLVSLEFFGGCDRDRTCDPLIKSQLLYQLSYAPTAALQRPARYRRCPCPCPPLSRRPFRRIGDGAFSHSSNLPSLTLIALPPMRAPASAPWRTSSSSWISEGRPISTPCSIA